MGSDYLVEMDIVLPPVMPLTEAHDIAEGLQQRLETLAGVGRAYVHIDTNSTHSREHKLL